MDPYNDTQRRQYSDREDYLRRQARARRRRQQQLRRQRRILLGLVIGAGILAVAVILLVRSAVMRREKAAAEARALAAEQEAAQAQAQAEEQERAQAEAEAQAEQALQEAAAGNPASLNAGMGDGFFGDSYTVTADQVQSIVSETIQSEYAILIDLDTMSVIAGKNYDSTISPASMTKILTVLTAADEIEKKAAEQGVSVDSILDETFEITIEMTDYAYKNDSSIVGFTVGEKPTVRDLMYGTILPSGADAAVALATYVAGSEADFVELMNQKLEKLGLSGSTHFTNCVGLYDANHYCTLTSMAMILKAALADEYCYEILSEHVYTTSSTAEHPDGIEISNWFLRRIEDKDTHGLVKAAKTGFVNESGSCAASYQISDSGGNYICVTANAWSAWRCIYDQVEIYDLYTN